jgi:hypothetical protein
LAVQFTVTVPEYGDPAEPSASAALFKPTVMLPGVVAEPPTVNHGVVDEAVNESTCATTLEATGIVLGDGTADVPEVSANDIDAEERTRSGAFGLIVPLTSCVAVTGFAAESATTTVKPKSAAAVGVPPSCPFDSVIPAGKVPLILNV